MPIAIGQGRNDVTVLQRQLKTDLKTLQDDERKHASQAIIAADNTRVQTDRQAIAAASSADTRQKSTEGSDGSRQAKPSTVSDATSWLPMSTPNTVDLYL